MTKSGETGDAKASLPQVPIETHSPLIAVLAPLACIYTMYWASAVFIPMMVSIFFS